MIISSLINHKKKTILSLDLDNTLVDRKKGDNFVSPLLKEMLCQISQSYSIIPIINTGRDIIGYRSFCQEVVEINNAILGSGSLIINEGKVCINKEGLLGEEEITFFEDAVRHGLLPFIDITYAEGRYLVFNEKKINNTKISELFYSQTPQTWFIEPQPRVEINEYIRPKNIFRIEFPVFKDQNSDLYFEIINKSERALLVLGQCLKVKLSQNNYTLKKKVFFNKDFEEKLIFARFQKNEALLNKGLGLKKWLKKEKYVPEDFNIIHIGDKDSGIINDVLIKEYVANTHIIMVNSKTNNNLAVSLYLNGDADEEIFKFIKELSELYI